MQPLCCRAPPCLGKFPAKHFYNSQHQRTGGRILSRAPARLWRGPGFQPLCSLALRPWAGPLASLSLGHGRTLALCQRVVSMDTPSPGKCSASRVTLSPFLRPAPLFPLGPGFHSKQWLPLLAPGFCVCVGGRGWLFPLSLSPLLKRPSLPPCISLPLSVTD